MRRRKWGTFKTCAFDKRPIRQLLSQRGRSGVESTSGVSGKQMRDRGISTMIN